MMAFAGIGAGIAGVHASLMAAYTQTDAPPRAILAPTR